MNNRIAKKIVKKYGCCWIRTELKEFNGEVLERNYDTVIFPKRYDNKRIRKIFFDRYGISLRKKETLKLNY